MAGNPLLLVPCSSLFYGGMLLIARAWDKA